MGKRLLLYVRPESMASLLRPGALGQQWEVHPVARVDRALELGGDAQFRVGMIVLDGWAKSAVPAVEQLVLATPHMRWVALVKTQVLARDALRDLIHQGFHDFHTLPPDIDRLRMTLGHAYGMAELEQTDEDSDGKYGMIGRSAAMHEIYRAIDKAAAVSAPVLIHGESGTGKELVALAIHQNSPRAEGPFVAVNCAALPANLIQSELFGHERGAFTGAHRRKIGKIEAAASGTIFLDEIGDLPLDLQVNLLRFLQDRKIERVGATESMSVDVRVIAASHVDLQRAVTQERFRNDLFYRLNVLRLEVPPLRDRAGDVGLLANHFFNEFRAERHPKIRGLGRSALEAMEGYDWPGNVRELINRVRHAMVMGEHASVTPADLGLNKTDTARVDVTLDRARDAAARSVIEATLQRAQFNISEAARRLGISRVTLYRLMQKYDLLT